MIASGSARRRGVAVAESSVAGASYGKAVGRAAPARHAKLRQAMRARTRAGRENPTGSRVAKRSAGTAPRHLVAVRALPAPPPAQTPVIGDAEVRQYLPLVRQVVQRMLPRKPPEIAIEDLLSWGVVGLIDAMRKYDRRREAAFPTYAQYRIRGSILDYLRRCDWMPRSVRQRSHDVEQATAKLEGRLGRPPKVEEIADALGMTLDEYARTATACGTVSLVPVADLGFGRGEESLCGDELLCADAEGSPMSKLLRKERVEILARAIEELPEKERFVVSFYYFEGLTMREVAEALHLTEGRISQLHSQAMLRLRGALSERPDEASLLD